MGDGSWKREVMKGELSKIVFISNIERTDVRLRIENSNQ